MSAAGTGRGNAVTLLTGFRGDSAPFPLSQVEQYLRDTAAPIWVNLSRGRAELYREIQSLQQGDSKFLERHFGRPGPFWGRQYLFWHGGKPLTLIHEAFSPALDDYLGPVQW